MLPGEASKGPGVEQEGREGSRQGCYSRCRSSLSLASPGALGHEWHGWLCLSSRQGPGPSQSHSVPAAVGKETWTLGPSDAAWGWQASLQHRRYQPPETRQGNRKMNAIVMLKDLEVTEPRGHAGQVRASFRAYAWLFPTAWGVPPPG